MTQIQKGQILNPTGKGGFGERPQDISSGSWKKENVFSYQYKRFMNMTLAELGDYRAKDVMEKLVVEELAYNTVMRAKNSLPDMKEVTDRTEGKAIQAVDVTTNGKDMPSPILGGISIINNTDDDIINDFIET